VLRRQGGPGRDEVFSDVLARFATGQGAITTGGNFQSVREADVRLAKGEEAGWLLEVRGEGDWIRYRNNDYLTSGGNLPVDVEARMPASVVESVARAFVEDSLSPFVALKEGEVLNPWTAAYLESVGTDESGSVHRSVIASRITFIRVLRGLPVLGPGSKITVVVANDAQPVGFDVDWSEFKATGKRTPMVELSVIRGRLRDLVSAEGEELYFECGYFDPGADAEERSVFLQPACVSARRAPQSSDLGNVVLVDFVPAGSMVLVDPGWPTTDLLPGG
jgi:hypothetical protein